MPPPYSESGSPPAYSNLPPPYSAEDSHSSSRLRRAFARLRGPVLHSSSSPGHSISATLSQLRGSRHSKTDTKQKGKSSPTPKETRTKTPRQYRLDLSTSELITLVAASSHTHRLAQPKPDNNKFPPPTPCPGKRHTSPECQWAIRATFSRELCMGFRSKSQAPRRTTTAAILIGLTDLPEQLQLGIDIHRGSRPTDSRVYRLPHRKDVWATSALHEEQVPRDLGLEASWATLSTMAALDSQWIAGASPLDWVCYEDLDELRVFRAYENSPFLLTKETKLLEDEGLTGELVYKCNHRARRVVYDKKGEDGVSEIMQDEGVLKALFGKGIH
jgi:hypothetical protein